MALYQLGDLRPQIHPTALVFPDFCHLVRKLSI